ncbi:MAG: hypothetical protein KDK54_10310 [Leptospiraceae bacterium]|nr:hypothetical protein [Leptospiraceae bacterium]
MLKGLLISILYCIAALVVFFLGYPYQNELDPKILVPLLVPILAIGLILGGVATQIYTDRFKKLFIVGLFLDYLASLFYAALMVLSDQGIEESSEVVISILMLGSTGFLMLGVLTIPPLLLGVFLIEKISKPKW